jgi:hypothetical protein
MAAIYVANRVKEACTGSGLNNVVLSGPMTGFRAFADAIPVGVKVMYLIQDGTEWEVGIGTLVSSTEISRDSILDSSTTTGEVNNQNAGSPTKLNLSDSQKTIGSVHEASRTIILDEDLLIANPSPFRRIVIKDTIEDMIAEEGLDENEAVICLGEASINDGKGGVFYWDPDDATAPDDVDTFRNDNEPTGLHKRTRLDIQGLVRSGVFEVDAVNDTDTGSSIYGYFRKKAAAATAWYRWLADRAASKLSLGIRFGQSASEKFFLHAYSLGNNFDRVVITEPLGLPSRTNSQGLFQRALVWLTGVSRLALVYADAADATTAADYNEIPITKGGYVATVQPTITGLKSIDAAKFIADGEYGLVLGGTAIGDLPAFYVVWSASSSATADDWSVFRPSTGAASTGNGRWLRVAANPIRTFTNSDATPSVANADWFVTAGTPPVAGITDFDDAHENKEFVVQRGSADCIIVHDPTKIDLGGQNLTLTESNPRAVFRHVNGIHRLLNINSGGSSDIPHIFDYITDPSIQEDILDYSYTTDVSTYIQAAVDDGVTVLEFPAGIFPLTNSVTADNISFIGPPVTDMAEPVGNKGTVFRLTSTVNVPFKLGPNVSMHGINAFWPDQVDSPAGVIAYPPFIKNASTSSPISGFTMTNCNIINPYDFFEGGGAETFNSCGAIIFNNVRVGHLRRCFYLNHMPEYMKLTNFMCGWSNYAYEMMHFGTSGAGATIVVNSITRATTTATVTCAVSHGLTTGQKVTISGATGGDASLYNGTFVVTVTGATTFTYTMGGTPSASATGTLRSTAYYLRDWAVDNSKMFVIWGDGSASDTASWSVDGIMCRNAFVFGNAIVVEVTGGTMTNTQLDIVADGCKQFLKCHNNGAVIASEFVLAAGCFFYRYNYDNTEVNPVFEIDNPAPADGIVAVSDFSIKGQIGFCDGTVIEAEGDYVRTLDVDLRVNAFGRTNIVGNYYPAYVDCPNARVNFRGRYEPNIASAGGVNKKGATFVDSTICDITNATFIACDNAIDIQDTGGRYLVNSCSSVDTQGSVSLNVASATNVISGYNNFDKPNTTIEPLPGNLPATATNDDAVAGNLGEVIESEVAVGSALALTTDTPLTITSITLTAGDWEVWAWGRYTGDTATTIGYMLNCISTANNTLQSTVLDAYRLERWFANTLSTFNPSLHVGPRRVKVANGATTTIYLVAQAGFATSTLSGYGKIRARRVR